MVYRVTVNFAGFVECDKTYTVDADSREEAEELAREMALDDISIDDIEEIEEGD
jgi:hypothetical protein